MSTKYVDFRMILDFVQANFPLKRPFQEKQTNAKVRIKTKPKNKTK